MATIAVANTLDDSGEAIVDLDAAGTQLVDASNLFYNTGNEVIVCSNASAGVRTLTVIGQRDPFGVLASNLACAIPAGKIGFIGFLNPAIYNAGGLVSFTVDAVATTKLAILRLRKIR